MPEAIRIFDESLSQGLAQKESGFILFKPVSEQLNQACFIFYPGGLVDELSYVPMLKDIANQGFVSYLLSMPMDLAVLSMGAAQDAKDDIYAKEHCERFVIAGHSLGGVAAADFVLKNPDDDLLLLAAYPQKSKSLSNHRGRVVSVYATNDGLTTSDDIKRSQALLPKTTEWLEIEGGNHAQFGWYGEQKDDGVSAVSRAIQQKQIVDAAIRLLKDD